MVRVSERRLVGLLREALRAADLEREAEALEAQAEALRADATAQRLLSAMRLSAVETDAAASLLDELPLTSTGVLHVDAFEALVQTRVWAVREDELSRLAIAGREE